MKFCKNLQRVVDISDPEWAPYWTNYKMLKVCLRRSRNRCSLKDRMAREREITNLPNFLSLGFYVDSLLQKIE